MRLVCRNSERDRICRWCDTTIPKGEKSIVMDGVRMRSVYLDIHFHEQCWHDMGEAEWTNE